MHAVPSHLVSNLTTFKADIKNTNAVQTLFTKFTNPSQNRREIGPEHDVACCRQDDRRVNVENTHQTDQLSGQTLYKWRLRIKQKTKLHSPIIATSMITTSKILISSDLWGCVMLPAFLQCFKLEAETGWAESCCSRWRRCIFY